MTGHLFPTFGSRPRALGAMLIASTILVAAAVGPGRAEARPRSRTSTAPMSSAPVQPSRARPAESRSPTGIVTSTTPNASGNFGGPGAGGTGGGGP